MQEHGLEEVRESQYHCLLNLRITYQRWKISTRKNTAEENCSGITICRMGRYAFEVRANMEDKIILLCQQSTKKDSFGRMYSFFRYPLHFLTNVLLFIRLHFQTLSEDSTWT